MSVRPPVPPWVDTGAPGCPAWPPGADRVAAGVLLALAGLLAAAALYWATGAILDAWLRGDEDDRQHLDAFDPPERSEDSVARATDE